jgi:hypothetical protein
MDEQIKQIQDYFKKKIFDLDFKIVDKISGFTVNIIIDEKYTFCIWIENDSDFRKNYRHSLSFMDLDFTNEESIILDSVIKKKLYHNDEYTKRIV